jgi:hypothetical protein
MHHMRLITSRLVSTVSRMQSHDALLAGQDELKLCPGMTRLMIPACCLPHLETTAITGWPGSMRSDPPDPQHAPLCEQLEAFADINPPATL